MKIQEGGGTAPPLATPMEITKESAKILTKCESIKICFFCMLRVFHCGDNGATPHHLIDEERRNIIKIATL